MFLFDSHHVITTKIKSTPNYNDKYVEEPRTVIMGDDYAGTANPTCSEYHTSKTINVIGSEGQIYNWAQHQKQFVARKYGITLALVLDLDSTLMWLISKG